MNRNVMIVSSVLGASIMAALAGTATASSLVNLQVLGSTNGGATFSNAVTANPGQQLQFEVLGQLAPVGTSNTQGTGTTISTVNPATDGIGSLTFNLSDSDSGVFSGLTLGSYWTQGTGAGGGTTSGNAITGIRPVGPNGQFAGAASPSVIETGTLTVGSLAAPEVVSGSWASGGSGSIKINGGTKTVFISATTESKSDPYVAYAPLTISAAPTPEPASLLSVSIGSLAVLIRRRRAN